MRPDRTSSVPAAGAAPLAPANASDIELLRRVSRQAALQSTALESSANAVLITDATGVIFWTNPAFSRISGYSAGEVIGRTPRLLKSGRHDAAFYRQLWRTVLEGRTWKGMLTNRRKDGALYHGEQTITPVRDEGGAVTHLIAVMNDVTAQRATQDELRATHAQLQHLLDHSPAVTYGLRLLQQRPVLHAVSNNVRRLLGYGPADVTASGWWLDHLHPDDRAKALVAHGGAPTDAWRIEYRLRHADGSYRWIEDIRRQVPAAAEERAEFVGHWHDITEAKRAEAVLHAGVPGGAASPRGAWRDLVVLVGLTAVVAAGLFVTDVLQTPVDWLLSNSQLADEILGSVIFACVGLATFGYRRWREAWVQIQRERELQAALRTLHGELDQRVQQRTAELAHANEVLRAEADQRRRAEADRDQDRELMRTMIDQVPDLIYVKDAESRFQLANDAIGKLMHVPPAELLGRTDAEFHPAARAIQFRADEVRVLAGETIVEKEEVATDGSGRIFLTTKLPRRDPSGKITGIIGIGREITDRRFAERALRLFRAQVDQSTDTLEIVDPDSGRFLDVNARGPIEHRCTRQEYLSWHVWDIETTVTRESWPALITRLRTEGALETEGVHRRKDGTVYPVEVSASWVQLDRDYIVVVVRDITARRKSEEALRDSQALYHSLVEQMPVGVFRKDAAGRYDFVNAWFCRATGLDPADCLGKRPAELVGRNDGGPAARMRDEIFAQGEEHHARLISGATRRIEAEKQWIMPDGTTTHLQVLKTPVFDSAGHIAGSQGVMFDVTARHRAETALDEQREQWRTLVTASSSAVFVVQDGKLALTNPATQRMLGLSEDALVGRAVFDIIAPEFHDTIRDRIRRGLDQVDPLPLLELKFHRPDGTALDVESSSVRCHFRGRPALLVEVRDITARKRTEAAARESESRFRQLAENVHEVFWLTDTTKHEMLYISPAYERVWGRTRAELVAAPHSWAEAIHPDDRPRVLAALPRQAEGGYDEEYRVIRPDGSERWIRDRAFPVRDEQGQIVRVAGVAEDVTEWKQATEELRRARDQYHSIFENSVEGIYQSTPEGTFLAANPALARILGYTSVAELIAERRDIGGQGYVDPSRRAEFKQLIEASGTVAGFEYEAYRRDGSRVWVSENAHLIRDGNGRPICYEGTLEDITNRKRAELRLRLQHAVTAVLAEASSVGQINRAILATIGGGLGWDFGEIWGIDRADNVLHCLDVHPPGTPDFAPLEKRTRDLRLARGQGLAGEVWATGRAVWSEEAGADPRCVRGTLAAQAGLHGWIGFPIRLRNDVVGVIGFFSRRVPEPDPALLTLLTTLGTQVGQFLEREQLAEQFRQAQKLEAIGTLAGGIAHDFNNIIAGISGYSELGLMDAGDMALTRECLQAVRQSSARAAGLVRQILAFSRQQEQQRLPIQLRHVVREATHLLRATVPATIDFQISLAPELPTVLADATQIHQVVMNLGTNAWHAMRECPGRLSFTLERCLVDEALAERHAGLRPGEYVRLSVSDTGHGIDAATLSRIFEPFFTTKGPGEGTGLGLSVVHGIMHSHDGVITVTSQAGQGTCFQLYFPACAAEAVDAHEQSGPLPCGHGERILFVDDEEALANMGRSVLERLGYKVDAFTGPQAALAAIRQDPAAYDLAITDLTMPGLTGLELTRELLAVRPNLPVLLATGHNGNLTASQVQALGVRELLLKPLSLHGLALVARRVLDEAKKG